MVQTVLAQPGLQLAVRFDARLEGFQRLQARRHVGLACSLGIDLLLLGAACFVQCGDQRFQFFELGVGHFCRLARQVELLPQLL